MNIAQTINTGFLILSASAVLFGFVRMEVPLQDVPATTWLFVVFYIFLRFKVFLDDHNYFGSADRRSWHFKVGFILALVSWLAWSLSGYMLRELSDAYFILGAALTISTIWIIADALRAGACTEQYYWIGTNAIYIILLWVLYDRSQIVDDWVSWAVGGILLVMVIVDFVISKSFRHLEEA